MNERQPASGIDLARIALQSARKAAAARGTTPAKRTALTGRDIARRGREAREPAPLQDVFALVAAHGWALGTAGGDHGVATLCDHRGDLCLYFLDFLPALKHGDSGRAYGTGASPRACARRRWLALHGPAVAEVSTP